MTGIYKYPVNAPIYLEPEGVVNDMVANKKVHGGLYKACYLFSADQYPYWKDKYPELQWDWGMFGENLSIANLDEAKIRIGNIYSIGTALVQISQPREPCYKLGIRFGSQEIIKQFTEHPYPGSYVRVLEKGSITTGDKLKLVEASGNALTIKQFYQLLFAKEKNQDHLKLAIENVALPLRKREKLKKWL